MGKSVITIYLNRRLFLMLILGFSSGLPLTLTGTTLAAWLVSYGVDLPTIGLFALTGLPYAGKFLWSPFMDRLALPFLGRRRGWILILQLALFISISAMGFLNPARLTGLTAFFTITIAFLSASQDIALDAYRTEYLSPEERGPGAAVWITGYRLAILVGGALGLILSDYLPWPKVFFLLAMTLLPCAIAVLLAPNTPADNSFPSQKEPLTKSLTLPFCDLLARRGAIEVLLFVVLYKIGDVAAAQMTTPYLLGHLTYTRTELGMILKGFGMIATIAGGIVGGCLLNYLTLPRSLFLFGVFQGLSTFTFLFLEFTGRSIWALSLVIGLENFTGGMGTAAYMTLLMSLCNTKFTATQYAFLSSLMAISRYLVGAPTGFLVASVGWIWFFTICTVACIPALILLRRFRRWQI
ncbi:MAG TPA: MFS transporter [Syntrophales bacterium]|nr:MFS transporter [Syntrophales bacterium]HOL58760.1 MFS transporter [Syntrophales bacterium]HPO34952.1 MFS transporter [Syntrophales bacterium]